MIIECQDGKLLESSHVVEWDIRTTGEGDEQTYTVIAHTVFDTIIDVFNGTELECEARKNEIRDSLDSEHTMLRHLCEGFTARDDKLSNSMNRLHHATQRLIDKTRG